MTVSRKTPQKRPAAMPVPSPVASRPTWMLGVAIFLGLLVIGNYARFYDPHFGWTKLIDFGESFSANALPRLKRSPHYVVENQGNDGEFYAQMAIDPSLRDPAFDHALDNPAYRARRIGVPALSFCLGLAKPRWVIQAYALSNLIFWFVLMGALIPLFRPWTGKQVMCFAAGLLGFGCITSMEHAMVDLPATAMLFVGFLLTDRGRYTALAAATLSRETNLLASLASLDWRRPFTAEAWKRNVGLFALGVVPFAVWFIYISLRFDGLHSAVGSSENFAFPLLAMAARASAGWRYVADVGLSTGSKAAGPFGWLYRDEPVHEILTVAAIFCQGSYLVWRREPQSAIWRTGLIYTLLGTVLGPAVWGWTGAAARVLLPMTICFYLQVAKERGAWFWTFFILGSLSIPFGVYEFWYYT